MPRKNKDGNPFDQMDYIKEWGKENMTTISGRYKKEFVQSFREACKKLGIKQSDVYRDAMKRVIEQAENVDKNQ
ncbi:hypothetical protein [uncultured Dubosiella sp.]|uniref:hypothetical protein n=1 Tax=uncultured Dubosiella sp. TaxID=1937011 RepID=UPI0027306F58|nr:hypothetical protein [uncultured Dubosiella sp.]